MSQFLLGYDARNKAVGFDSDDRKTHMHVIGSSGSGKSKFLESMLRGDLKNRQGFCLVDPHGTLYNDVADYCAHHVLDREIILLNLSKPDSIIGFNPFQRVPGADISVQVDRRIAATMHAWNVQNTDDTPTLARTLRLIYTVMIECNLGLRDVQHLIDFTARDIRANLVEQLTSPLVKREWQELQILKAKDWRDETLSAKNRLFKFLTSDVLCRFMGVTQRSINLKQIMDEGKVLLVNLAESDHLSHEGARAFGSLLVNEFFECALRRQKDARGRDPKPYYLYMDEFQNFVSLDIANMLDQVRKFGLFLVLAHQRFGHLDEDLTDAVLTNCRVKAVFGGLPVASARLMAEELFIGELDPMKIKVAIYQTKFWPTYSRDKVYGKSSSRGTSHGTMEGSASASMSSSASGQSFYTGSDWFGSLMPGAMSEMSSSGTNSASSSGSSTADMDSTSESEIDIPIMLPVPFQELSSVQYFTTEEQLTQLTAALKEQFPRHCFIKIHGQKTQPMLVPFVKGFYTTEENLKWYRDRQLTKQHALLSADVDLLLEAQETALLQGIRNTTSSAESAPEKPTTKTESTAKSHKAKAPKPSIFDAALGGDSPIGRD